MRVKETERERVRKRVEEELHFHIFRYKRPVSPTPTISGGGFAFTTGQQEKFVSLSRLDSKTNTLPLPFILYYQFLRKAVGREIEIFHPARLNRKFSSTVQFPDLIRLIHFSRASKSDLEILGNCFFFR